AGLLRTGRRVVGGEVEEVTAVRKKIWPAIRRVNLRVDACYRLRRAAPRGHAEDRRANVGCEDDVARGGPASAAGVGRVAEGRDRTPSHFDPSEFALREEADRPSVGRPEGRAGALGSRQGRESPGAQGLDPELAARRVDDRAPVGR